MISFTLTSHDISGELICLQPARSLPQQLQNLNWMEVCSQSVDSSPYPLSSCRSSYNDNSQEALAVEGSFNAVTAGILIYMATVDLIAHDFFSEKVLGNSKLLWGCFVAVLLGMGAMDLLAYWA